MMEKWIDWYLRSDIPKRAFLIGDEVIPLPPVPDEYLEDFAEEINTNCLWHTEDLTEVEKYGKNTFFVIERYNNLTKQQRIDYANYINDINEWFENIVENPWNDKSGVVFNWKARKNLRELLFHNYQYLYKIQKRLERFAQNDFEDKLKTSSCQGSASTPIDVETLADKDRDEYYLSISDDDERRAIMRVKGKMKPQAIKKWEEVRGFPFCSIHGIYESINRGKNKLHIPKKTRKQSNSKPKK